MKPTRCVALALLLSACSSAPRSVLLPDGEVLIDNGKSDRKPDVIFVPTKMEVVEQMLTFATVDSTDVVYDLGSGDGRIVITAAKRRGARGVGVDIDPQRIRESVFNADTAGVSSRVEFRRADLFRTDLRPATAVTLYLLPHLNVLLRPKLFAELKPGTPVVSNSFEMGDWQPDSTVLMDERTIFLWIIPANANGRWQFQMGDTAYGPRGEINISQHYQIMKGTVRFKEQLDSLRLTRVRGDSVSFMFNIDGVETIFDGVLKDSMMMGKTRDAKAVEWRALRRLPPRKL